jgi:hypothetical protein
MVHLRVLLPPSWSVGFIGPRPPRTTRKKILQLEITMKLKLAIVKSCDREGCIVQSIEDGNESCAVYSHRVKGKIKISRDQLVALDRNNAPSELVWRWVRAEVDSIDQGSLLLDDRRGQLIRATIPAELDLQLETGEEVWWCKTGEAIEVHARTADFDHEQEKLLVKYIQPIISKHYSIK